MATAKPTSDYGLIRRQCCVDVWAGGLDGGQIMPRVQLPAVTPKRRAWNKGRLVGQKRPLLPKRVWAIRARLELAGNLRDLALFNVAIDSKLRGCDLVILKVTGIVRDDRVRERVSVVQSKTNKPVQFELAENTRETVTLWIRSPEMIGCQFLFPSRFHDRPHISTRQYGRLVRDWVVSIGLEPSGYGTHSMRRTKVAEIYRKTGNLRAVQLLLGHTKVDSTVRYLGVELEDALSISEQVTPLTINGFLVASAKRITVVDITKDENLLRRNTAVQATSYSSPRRRRQAF